jgi:aminopeptidase N
VKFLFQTFFVLLWIQTSAQQKIDVLHYQFKISLNDTDDSLHGEAQIQFMPLESINEVSFDLVKIGKKGMTVWHVFTYNGDHDLKSADYEQKNNKVIIKNNYVKGRAAYVNIMYDGIPEDGLIISKNRSGIRTFFADNWPNRAHNWIPCVDDPADKASVEFIVFAPSHYQVVSNGVQVEESNLPGGRKLTHYKEDVPLPTKVMVIGAADFAVNNIGDTACIPVSSWVYAEEREKGFHDYSFGKDILGFFINYIGPYPYKKLANVQYKTRFGGMENAGAIFYNESTVSGKRDEERLFAHEIVHQWFGNSATEKSFAHFWLSEGFATYLTHVFLESKYGKDTLRARMKEEREEVISFVKKAKRPVVDSTKDYMTLLNANSYQKGSWVLHMLRRETGDSAFHKIIRSYYATYGGRNAETSDFQKIAEAVSGKNLAQFFKQWLFTPENLKLEISWKYDKTKKQVSLTVKQLQNDVFEFPLEISVQDGASNMPRRMNWRIDKRNQVIEFPAAVKPSRLEIDPMITLLYEGSLHEQQ